MSKYIVIDKSADVYELCNTEDEAKAVVQEWMQDGYIGDDDIEILKVQSKYKLKTSIELVKVEDKLKTAKPFKGAGDEIKKG